MYITITEQIIQNKVVTHTDYNTGVRGDINVQDMRKKKRIKGRDHADLLTKPVEEGSRVISRVFWISRPFEPK